MSPPQRRRLKRSVHNSLYTIFNEFSKKRDKKLKNNFYLGILIYFFILFVIDKSGSINLWGTNIIRRCIRMYRRTDPLTYKKKLKPFCIKYDKILDKNDISKLQSIRIPDKKDFRVLTRKNTTTHQCCENYSKDEVKIIEDVREKIKKHYENKIQKKLYKIVSSYPTIYRYHGNNSNHLWHVDPRNISEIYNVIVCIKKKGNISPLQCKTKDEEEYSIHFEEGDAALFNGGTTVHQVPPNNDPNSERTVLSIAYTSDEKLSKDKNLNDNMCTFIQGGNNYGNMIKIFLTVFLINIMLTQFSGINNLSYKFLLLFFIINVIIVKYVPLYFDTGLGTNRPSSIYHNFILLVIFILGTFSIKGAIVMFSYFLLSEIFFPRKWVEYD